MERLAYMISDFFIRKNIIEEKQREICRYGYEVILSTILGGLLVIGISLLVGQLEAGIIFLLIFSSVRKFCGGYHADSYIKCNLVLILVLLVYLGIIRMMLSDNPTVPVMCVMMYLLYMACIIAYAPIDNENKRLSGYEKIKYRRISLIIGVIVGMVSAILYIVKKEYAIMIIVTIFLVTILMVIQVKRRDCDEPDIKGDGKAGT